MKTRLTLLLALLLICAAAALAQPPGQGPCDAETGAASGLCNAYLAMECPTPNPSASAIACSKVAAKFKQITGRDLPSCPCVGIAGFNNILANLNTCIDEGDRVNVSTGFLPDLPDLASANAENSTCGYGIFNPPSDESLSITLEQSLMCLYVIRTAAADRHVTCQFPS